MSDEAAASNAVELEIDLTGSTAPEAGSNASAVGGSSSAKAQEAASEEVDRGALDPEPEPESLKKHDGSSGGGEKQSKPKCVAYSTNYYVDCGICDCVIPCGDSLLLHLSIPGPKIKGNLFQCTKS